MVVFIKKWFLLIWFWGLTSCLPNGKDALLLPTLQPRPDFVLEVSPRELELVPLALFQAQGDDGREVDVWDDIGAYNSFICLKVETGLLAQRGDDFRDDLSVVERVTMKVGEMEIEKVYANGILLQSIHVIDANGEYLMMGIEPKLICGEVDLSVGVHKVLFQFRQTSGDVLEYEWLFELVDE